MNGWYGIPTSQPGRTDQSRRAVVVQRPSHFGDQPGLAGARLTGHKDELAAPAMTCGHSTSSASSSKRRPTIGAWRAANSRADNSGGAHGVTVTSRSFAKAVEPFRSLP